MSVSAQMMNTIEKHLIVTLILQYMSGSVCSHSKEGFMLLRAVLDFFSSFYLKKKEDVFFFLYSRVLLSVSNISAPPSGFSITWHDTTKAKYQICVFIFHLVKCGIVVQYISKVPYQTFF